MISREAGGVPSILNESLLNAPPEVELDGVHEFLKSHYGVVGEAQPLSGERDRTFHIRGDRGTDYVFKIAHPDEDPGTTDLQIEVLLYLSSTAPSLPVQRVIPALNGTNETRFPLPNGTSASARLVSYVPGEVLRFSRRTPDQRRNLGRLCAEMGLALRDFEHHATKQRLAWDIAQAGELAPLVSQISRGGDQRALLMRCLDNFNGKVAPALAKLRAQPVHNDFNRNNIIVDAVNHDRIVAVIDFGDMVHTALANDVAIGAANQLSESEDLLDWAFEFIAGYHEVVPLGDDELNLMHDLITVRVAMSILITEWRGARFPERRDYIMRNTPANWIRLGRLLNISPEDSASALRRACSKNG